MSGPGPALHSGGISFSLCKPSSGFRRDSAQGSGLFLPAAYPWRRDSPHWRLPLRQLSVLCFHDGQADEGLKEVGGGGRGDEMPRETQRYESKSTPHFSSWPFQSEDGLPQSTQTSRLNPSSLFEQRPDKACLAESAPGPSGHGNGRIHWAMGAGEVCAGLSWPLLCPSGGGRYWVLCTCILSCPDVFMP